MNAHPRSRKPAPEPVLRRLAQAALKYLAGSASSGEAVQIHAVFDRDTDHYLLIAEGWQGYRRVYRTVAHIAVSEGCLYIYEDGTVEGIAEWLRAKGVPPECIVCKWANLPAQTPPAD